MEPKEQTKAIKGKSNYQWRAAIIFDDLINKIKKILNELYERLDINKFYFEYVGPTKDVSFYEYMDSKGLFKELKNNRIKI